MRLSRVVILVTRVVILLAHCACVMLMSQSEEPSSTSSPTATTDVGLSMQNASHVTKGSDQARSAFAYLHQSCGYGVPDGKECDPIANLVCNEFQRTQWAKCVCVHGTHPHEENRGICVHRPKRLLLGDECRPNAPEDEESCVNDLALCGEAGVCVCGNDSWTQVLYDVEHKACYLKSQPRHLLLRGHGAGGSMGGSIMAMSLALHPILSSFHSLKIK